MTSIGYRLALVAGLTVLALVYLMPSLTVLPDWWRTVLPTGQIRLGLDLRGGTHLLLEIDLD